MRLPITTPGRLREYGITGINERNLHFIFRYNNRSDYPLVDDKIRSKNALKQSGINVPEMLAVIDSESRASNLIESLRERASGFVIKPARGSAGRGVMLITDIVSNLRGFSLFRRPSGQLMTADRIKHHISNILSGIYSLGDTRDRAMAEELVQPASPFKDIIWVGVPDIRVLLLHGYPVMAMARLPTLQSKGRANLHLGAVGVGIGIADGRLHGGEHLNHFVNEHPDTLMPLAGHTIPDWEQILLLSSRCYELTKIGYLGVDMIIDKLQGPLILELNARPGISIQLANRMGLNLRLQKAEEWKRYVEPAEKRVARAIKVFA